MKIYRMTNNLMLAAVALVVIFLATIPAASEDDRSAQPSCAYCGMDRSKFAHSRAFITYEDGTRVGTCSLHCAAIDLSLKIDKAPTSILVADYNTKELIDAESAFWVIGGSKMGVMTKRAKWSFASEDDAAGFMQSYGGEKSVFSEAVKAAFEDMHDDLQMIRAKRKKMASKSHQKQEKEL